MIAWTKGTSMGLHRSREFSGDCMTKGALGMIAWNKGALGLMAQTKGVFGGIAQIKGPFLHQRAVEGLHRPRGFWEDCTDQASLPPAWELKGVNTGSSQLQGCGKQVLTE